jgi:NADH-quinone oxidoreductase subunit F
MDLRLIDALPTADERAAVDEVLGAPTTGWEGAEVRTDLEGHVAKGGHEARSRRDLLLPALHAVQATVGWISRGALGYICRRLTIPPAEAYGVASFYEMLSLDERPPTVVHVCDDIACMVNGAERLCSDLERELGPEGEPALDGRVSWKRSPCLGMCGAPPAVLVQRAEVSGRRGDVQHIWATARGALGEFADPPRPVGHVRTVWGAAPSGGRRILRTMEQRSKSGIADYRRRGGFDALRKALNLGPEGVIREVKESKLLGRGGAAFPTGVKWEAVANQSSQPHYFVCNADESEPGTFKDAALIVADPIALIEAVTIAGFAVGAESGWIYIRGEYPLAYSLMKGAVDDARAAGFLGTNILGSGFDFDIEVRRGAGAYIAGEETALFNSIEGKRPEPRNKPPFPVTHGLFGKPTGVNNVETLLNVLEILRIGGAEYAKIGTPDSTGTRLFCLSGTIQSPGVYEVEFGTTLRELLELAGGVPAGRELQAVLLGGAAGSFATPDELDVRLSFEDTRAAGLTLGSGAVIVFDDTVDLDRILLRIARFFRDESCGQCVPCRVGTVRQEELVHRLHEGRPIGARDRELTLLTEIGQGMRDASICGLGQTAWSAIQSAVTKLGAFDGRRG